MQKINNLFNKINNLFDKPSIEEISAYQHKIPKKIKVQHFYDKNTGYYTAKIVEIDGKKIKGLIITESKTTDGLINMVNDAIFTYLDIPERMKSSLPKMMPKDIDFADKFIKNGQLVLAK